MWKLLWLLGCSKEPEEKPPLEAPAPYSQVSRHEFQQAVIDLNLPFFWTNDDKTPGVLDPSELAIAWRPSVLPRSAYIEQGKFRERFQKHYDSIIAWKLKKNNPERLSPDERSRREAVARELEQGRPTLIFSDLSSLSESEKEVFSTLLRVADLIEVLYAKQRGTHGFDSWIPASHPASGYLYLRNHGPMCIAPKTAQDPDCAVFKPYEIRSGLYPSKLQSATDFCAILEQSSPELFDPFSIVKDTETGYTAVPFSKAYVQEMGQIHRLLNEAADLLPPEELSFAKYLRSVGEAFLTNQWTDADTTWLSTNSLNSKWYLRIGPDNPLSEPCHKKAAFHLILARYHTRSTEWKQLLEPVQQEMEEALANLVGLPYRAREVQVSLPEFASVILQAGDSRKPIGGALGQYFPMWGDSSKKSGKSIVFVNLSDDHDTKKIDRTIADSLFCPHVMTQYPNGSEPRLMTTLLQKVAHHLGPSTPVGSEVTNSILDSLKAKSSAMFLTGWLVDRALINNSLAQQAHVADILRAIQSLSDGMHERFGEPKTEAQVSAILLGYLFEHDTLSWERSTLAANGTDLGCFNINLDTLPTNIGALTEEVLQIKSGNNSVAAEQLIGQFTRGAGSWSERMETITERVHRFSQPSYLYAWSLPEAGIVNTHGLDSTKPSSSPHSNEHVAPSTKHESSH